MSFNYSKLDYRGGVDDGKASPPNLSPRTEDGAQDGDPPPPRSFHSRANDVEDPEMKTSHHHHDGPMTQSKSPGDVKNGDLVSLLLAATPPYLYNIPLIPQTFFFSEMLKSFVQAKAERQSLKAQQTHYKRGKKRSWRESSPPKANYYEMDKPLELTTPRQGDARDRPSPKRLQTKATEKKSDFVSSNFTAEKLANSSVTGSSSSSSSGGSSGVIGDGAAQPPDLLPPTPPLWYPPLYPPHPPFGIDPLHFFIDLRVSTHVWDRKLPGDGERWSLGRSRHGSAFGAPEPRSKAGETAASAPRRSPRSVHYLMTNLRRIYGGRRDGEGKAAPAEPPAQGGDDGEGAERKCKDLRALIGLELVVDYVKQESDEEEDDKDEDMKGGQRRLLDVDGVSDGTCH